LVRRILHDDRILPVENSEKTHDGVNPEAIWARPGDVSDLSPRAIDFGVRSLDQRALPSTPARRRRESQSR